MKKRIIKKLEKRALCFQNGQSDYMPKHYLVFLRYLYQNGFSAESLKMIGSALKSCDIKDSEKNILISNALKEVGGCTSFSYKKNWEAIKNWNDNNKEYKAIWQKLKNEKHNYGEREDGVKGHWTVAELEYLNSKLLPWQIARDLKRNLTSVTSMINKLKKEQRVMIDVRGMEKVG